MRGKLDPWDFLRRHTHARIALGRAGHSIPTKELLDFRLAHSLARDSVKQDIDIDRLADDLKDLSTTTLKVQSRCSHKQDFLLNPNLGRQLSSESKETLQNYSSKAIPPDCVLIIADGLSTHGIQTHSATFAKEFIKHLLAAKISLGPIIIAKYSRVALGDEIGLLLKTRSVLVLIGERPGLGSSESMSVYFTFDPKLSKTDADRNCISNIHPNGLSPLGAASMAAFLVHQSLVRGLSGVDLKIEYPALTRPLF